MRLAGVLAISILIVVAVFGQDSSVRGAEAESCWPFFVFDNGLRGIADPPKLLRELGFAGMGASGLKIADLVKQYQAAGLKVFSTYVGCQIDQTPPYDPLFRDAVRELQGSGVILWLTVRGGNYGKEDDKAVAIVREIADLAEPWDVRVALYPHTGFYVATTASPRRPN